MDESAECSENSDCVGKVLYDANKSGLTHEEIWDDELLIQHYNDLMKKTKKKLAEASNSCHSDSALELDRHKPLASRAPIVIEGSKRTKKKKKQSKRHYDKWEVGDYCRAPYSYDGRTYEGTILRISNTRKSCTVRFVGYENEEIVDMKELSQSHGISARKMQVQQSEFAASQVLQSDESSAVESDVASEDVMHDTKHRTSDWNSMMPPPVPQSASSQRPPEVKKIPTLPDLPPPPILGIGSDSLDDMSAEALHTMLMSWYMTGYHTGYFQGLRARRHNKRLK